MSPEQQMVREFHRKYDNRLANCVSLILPASVRLDFGEPASREDDGEEDCVSTRYRKCGEQRTAASDSLMLCSKLSQSGLKDFQRL